MDPYALVGAQTTFYGIVQLRDLPMKIRFSLKQIFGMALIGSVFWTIILGAYWDYGWAIGATTAMALFGLVSLLSLVIAMIWDRLAFIFYRR